MARKLIEEVEELQQDIEILQSQLAGERVNNKNHIGKLEHVALQMWKTLLHVQEDGVQYLPYIMPEIKRSMVHLGLVDEEYLAAQQEDNEHRYKLYNRITELEETLKAVMQHQPEGETIWIAKWYPLEQRMQELELDW